MAECLFLGELLLYNWSRFVNTKSHLCAFFILVFMFLAHECCWRSQSSLTVRLYTAGEEIEAVDQTKDPQWRTCIIIWQSCSTSYSTYSEVLKLCLHDVEQWTVKRVIRKVHINVTLLFTFYKTLVPRHVKIVTNDEIVYFFPVLSICSDVHRPLRWSILSNYISGGNKFNPISN